MGQISEALNRLRENPDDLSSLPQLIAQVGELEDTTIPELTQHNDDLHNRNKELQDRSNHLLAQIPIPGHESTKTNDSNKEVTAEEGIQNLLENMKEVE